MNALTPSEAAGDYTLDAGAVTVTVLPRERANRATIRLVAGSAGATISGLRLRGQPITSSGEDEVSARDSGSVTAYGPHGLPYNVWAGLLA